MLMGWPQSIGNEALRKSPPASRAILCPDYVRVFSVCLDSFFLIHNLLSQIYKLLPVTGAGFLVDTANMGAYRA